MALTLLAYLEVAEMNPKIVDCFLYIILPCSLTMNNTKKFINNVSENIKTMHTDRKVL